MYWYIVHFKGSQVEISKFEYISVSEDCFSTKAYSADFLMNALFPSASSLFAKVHVYLYPK